MAKSSRAAFWIRAWLILIGLMVYAMILIGGATRLTDSGLSITEWDPIRGAMPPLGDAAWAELFEKYKTTTEYRLQNQGMSLGEFKYIFWWEWGHRLFGRLIGLIAVGGFALFWWRGWMSRALTWRLLGLIGLGALQGFIGWWMVASGIGETTRVDVAPYRLMTHFCLALLIIAVTAWSWLDLGNVSRPDVSAGARAAATGLLVLTGAQMAAGALVAGLDAGRTYTDWPLMAGAFWPSNYMNGLGLRALFESVAATQFNHRILAYVLFAASLASLYSFRRSALAGAFALVASLVTLQSAWGVLTLLNAAPLQLALIHQGFGVLVLLGVVRLRWLTQFALESGKNSVGSANTTL